MNNILTPEKNKSLLKGYHTSSKLLIPTIIGSYFLNTNSTIERGFHTLNILNIGYHSYVSTSCILTDYVKPVYLSKSSRFISLGIHSLAIYGYLHNIYKK
tara:strand:+ start:2780 stop:3079 length:300 start_codon:yes stop_codon:yes gene_type:complete